MQDFQPDWKELEWRNECLARSRKKEARLAKREHVIGGGKRSMRVL
jgi:hypothetical protein